MPRNDLTLASKIAVLDKIKSQPMNTSHRRLAELTGVPKSSLSRLKQQESQLRDEWALREGDTTYKRKRDGKAPDVEEALDQWLSIVSKRGVSINGPLLKAKSEEFAIMLGYTDFKATDGWLSRWKARRNIKLKNIRAKKECAEQWQSPAFLDNFRADDIYSADETGLYYRATPDGSLCFETLPQKARITVFCCANMSGTDKHKLLIIGKREKPRCFYGLRMDGLPVDYYYNNNAWMTSNIFRNWLQNWDLQLQHKQRHILLLVNTCAAHPFIDKLKHIKLVFLPANTMQPMGMGIHDSLKTSYRGKLVHYILESIDENLINSSASATEIGATIHLLQAIQFLADSWRAIPHCLIQNCFAVCGLKRLQNSETLRVKDNTKQVSIVNYDEYLTIDNDLLCYDDNEDTTEEVSKAKQQKLDEDSDDEDVPVPVTTQEAKKCIASLQRYFMQVGNDLSPTFALNTCADFVQLQSYKDRLQ